MATLWLLPDGPAKAKWFSEEETTIVAARLADDVASADWLILSKVWEGWNEPNASTEFGSDAPNRVVDERFCRVVGGRFVELWHRCA